MPHCLLSQVKLPPLPYEQEQYCFELEVCNANQSLILATFGEYEFLIRKRYRPKQNDFILKCEKMGVPTGIIKGALQILADYNSAYLISHNLANSSIRQNLLSPFYKNITDFLDFSTPFELEIGFGSGRHILQKAKNNPSRLFIGIELYTPSIEQVLRQIELLGLQNLWIINFDARIFLELLPSNLCEAIYLHFPVPWNKKPHRRVFGEKFLQEALRVLNQNAFLELRSDDEQYFLDALELTLKEQKLQIKIAKNMQKEVVSKYEQRWQKQNKNIYDLSIQSLQISKPKEKLDSFAFYLPKTTISFDKIPLKIIQDDWFLHIDSLYSSPTHCILFVCFGDFNQPQNKFILIEKDKVRYINGEPLATRASVLAHRELSKIIKEQGEKFECLN